MRFMKKLLVCNVVLLCTLAGLKADDTTPTIHLDKFYTAANNRGALAILGYYGAVKQSSVDVEGVIAMKDKIKDLTKRYKIRQISSVNSPKAKQQ